MKDLPSNRQYLVAFIEGEAIETHYPTLSDILNPADEWEWKYAIQEDFDKILDLKIGERLMMNFNRDNKDSSGILKRIK